MENARSQTAPTVVAILPLQATSLPIKTAAQIANDGLAVRHRQHRCNRVADNEEAKRSVIKPDVRVKWRAERWASVPVAALQSQQAMFRKNRPLMSGFEWIIILFVGVIPFRAAEVVAEALGYSHVIALAGGIVVMAICVLAYFAIRPMMLPD
jgi:hypothetical protein